MIFIRDIYYKVDSELVQQNFWKLDIEQKKKLIDSELKKYIVSKLKELDSTLLLESKNEKMNVGELLVILSNNIPEDQHFDTLRHFTHYILQVASSLQSWSITWWNDNDVALNDSPIVKFDENGLWTDLITSDNIDYIKTFNCVYDVFNNNFMVKKGDGYNGGSVNEEKSLILNQRTDSIDDSSKDNSIKSYSKGTHHKGPQLFNRF